MPATTRLARSAQTTQRRVRVQTVIRLPPQESAAASKAGISPASLATSACDLQGNRSSVGSLPRQPGLPVGTHFESENCTKRAGRARSATPDAIQAQAKERVA